MLIKPMQKAARLISGFGHHTEKPLFTMRESVDQVIRQYIDFVNHQVGVYMDALAGFAGHYARTEIKMQRILRKEKTSRSDEGHPVLVYVSYEDPSQKKSIHNRIIRAKDYLSINSPGGSNEQQHSHAVLVFLFTYWEDEIRPRLAALKKINLQEIRSDIMGDLRILRNVILHSKGIIRRDKYNELKKLKDMFVVDQLVHVSYEGMHRIFVLIKQDCARMLFEWIGETNMPVQPEEIAEISIDQTGSFFVTSNTGRTFRREAPNRH